MNWGLDRILAQADTVLVEDLVIVFLRSVLVWTWTWDQMSVFRSGGLLIGNAKGRGSTADALLS